MGLSSFKFVQWAPKDASFLHQRAQSAFWPFTVIQGRWFWYQSKARMWLPISRSLQLWFYLAPFLRYGDLLANIFHTPLSFGALAPMFPLEFCGEDNHKETRVTGLSSSKDPMIVAWVVLTQCQRVTDRRTDL